ncbi:hypothetical protein ABB25_12950 [Stenotrophomonas koreensis]|uniref:X-Tfes XVIPCD domain-containing protein n=1 Tax=Stenotrophomonas koreensis TaxID=266128 RepID=A0A0R0BND1_9GAMM|nr:XVIPCD domain-containing protein [Stenotrophomonas koreensis]KRG55204.1 hypothetical protein ABB25_12950 [Stenotrophomonas koreensis]
MKGLTEKDLQILQHYAAEGNRVLYFNYLAALEGVDKYPAMALGVGNNDSLAGQIANRHVAGFVARQQSEHGSQHPDRTDMTERDWEQFGIELIRQDLERRQFHMRRGDAHLALNLPGEDVKLSHERAFEKYELDPRAWTPQAAMEAVLAAHGEKAMQAYWEMQLDGGLLNMGAWRAGETMVRNTLERGWWDGGIANLGLVAHGSATLLSQGADPTLSYQDPNRIVLAGSLYQHTDQGWMLATRDNAFKDGLPHDRLHPLADPALREVLDDTRQLRLEKQQLRQDYHPDDPNRGRPLQPSADLGEEQKLELEHRLLAQTQRHPANPDHPAHALYTQTRAGVEQLDAQAGRVFDVRSENMTLALTAQACTAGLTRVDAVLLSCATAEAAAAARVFAVQGAPQDPAHCRTHLPTAQACQQPGGQSLALLEQASEQQQQARAQEQLQAQAPQQAPARQMA